MVRSITSNEPDERALLATADDINSRAPRYVSYRMTIGRYVRNGLAIK